METQRPGQRERRLKIDLIPALKKLEVITKQNIASAGLVGQYSSVFKGRGLEFEDYRPYSTLDDASMIDWKASKRSGQILVKEYVEERNVNVAFVFDVSESMIFGSLDKLKNEYSIEFIASLTHAILEVGDSAGLVMFNDKIVKFIPCSRNRAQFYDMARTLSNPYLYGGRISFFNVSKFLLTALNRDTVVIIVSDFIGFEKNWVERLKLLCSKFDVVGVMIRDPLDRTMPVDYQGTVLIKDPYSHKQMVIDPSLLKEAYEYEARKQEEEIEESFISAGADFTVLSTDQPFVKPVIKLFRARAGKFKK